MCECVNLAPFTMRYVAPIWHPSGILKEVHVAPFDAGASLPRDEVDFLVSGFAGVPFGQVHHQGVEIDDD